MNWPKRCIYGSSGFSVTSTVPFHLVDQLSWMEILAVCHAWGVLPFWSWKMSEKCCEAKSVRFSLRKISKAKFVAVSGVSPFSLETFIFQVACGFGCACYVSRGEDIESGGSSPSLEFSRCSPLAFEPQIDFWQVLDEEVVPVISLVSRAIRGAGDLVRKEKHRENGELFLSSFSFVFNPLEACKCWLGSHL